MNNVSYVDKQLIKAAEGVEDAPCITCLYNLSYQYHSDVIEDISLSLRWRERLPPSF